MQHASAWHVKILAGNHIRQGNRTFGVGWRPIHVVLCRWTLVAELEKTDLCFAILDLQTHPTLRDTVRHVRIQVGEI